VRFQIIEEALRRAGQLDDELLIEGVEVCLRSNRTMATPSRFSMLT
jgi:hypothetical protein